MLESLLVPAHIDANRQNFKDLAGKQNVIVDSLIGERTLGTH